MAGHLLLLDLQIASRCGKLPILHLFPLVLTLLLLELEMLRPQSIVKLLLNLPVQFTLMVVLAKHTLLERDPDPSTILNERDLIIIFGETTAKDPS